MCLLLGPQGSDVIYQRTHRKPHPEYSDRLKNSKCVFWFCHVCEMAVVGNSLVSSLSHAVMRRPAPARQCHQTDCLIEELDFKNAPLPAAYSQVGFLRTFSLFYLGESEDDHSDKTRRTPPLPPNLQAGEEVAGGVRAGGGHRARKAVHPPGSQDAVPEKQERE